ncbi:dihydropteroate synthase [Nafulsella turpanensis]|uniref:dihydropteroate synthase n=1 Tax=Nafulsella turpanensis TaxID=1265690 RepID=UPI00034CBC85|nr:dihydropteroate synthase [Nafulsella turpanensis]
MKAKDTGFSIKKTLNLAGNLLDLSQPRVMGILNITPDSFYENSRKQSEKSILLQTEKMLQEGADIIDIGAYSSRPGAADISAEEEWSRLQPAIRSILQYFPETYLSVDTFRAGVAEKAVAEGACMVNDISGGELDPAMFKTIARLQVPYILMHMRGAPQNMKELNGYDDLLHEIYDYFALKLNKLSALGVNDIVIDPGFGFAKNIAQNYELLQNMGYFSALEVPVLVGISRKSMIYKKLNISPAEALNGTTVLHTISLMQGASLLRVHDVKEAVEAVKLFKLTFSAH